MKDFWEPFEWYLGVEKGLAATYFLIPFKRRAGEKVPRSNAPHRATAYDASDLAGWIEVLRNEGCELGVHGIDAWHDVDKGRQELARVAAATGESATGIRMHWLLQDEKTPLILEQAGFSYDSTCGYNETVGYRAGTTQVFRPEGASTLLEIPMHIQDGALFFPQQLDLSEQQAESRCQVLIDNAKRYAGVVTVLWHDRSHGPERFWGGFYVKLLQTLKSLNCWFATAQGAVSWFKNRRNVRFERSMDGTGVRIQYEGGEISPPFNIRVHACRDRRYPGRGIKSRKHELRRYSLERETGR